MVQVPRIAPVEHFDSAQEEALGKTLMNTDGRPMNVFKTLAHAPQLLRRVNAVGGYFVVDGTIPVREREIVILRTAARARTPYVEAHHRRLGAEAGLSSAEIDAAVDPDAVHPWAPLDAALLDMSDELVAGHTVSDDTWQRLEPFGDRGRLELVVLVGHYSLLAGVLNAARTPIDADITTKEDAP